MPLTRPTPTNANAVLDLRRYAIFYSNAGIGRMSDNKCGQASDHVWTSNAFSVARQWQYKQQR
ncbi:hypothetical protein B0O99DRAFT_646708 [Bisporella sp. PMI_857]|nr:hypothetical protein B0O99DRAFT_646708 [Bisporella sp. PMI_857]